MVVINIQNTYPDIFRRDFYICTQIIDFRGHAIYLKF